MDSGYALHGHARSMTSLAAILPISFDLREWSASAPPRMAEELISEPPDRIPLPPSVAGSEYSGEADRIPLPPSVASSEYGEDAEPLQMEALSLRMMNGDVREQPPLEAPPVEDTESKPTSDDSWDRPQEPEQDSIPRAEHTTVQEETRMEATSPELPIPFLDLVSIIRRDAYEQVRYQALQSNVSRLLYDCGINGRYIPIQSHLYRRMVECFRSDKKTAFASLYTQSVNIGRSRDPNAHILVPELASGIAQSTQEGSATQLSWIQMLPPGSERNVMKFLTSIRTDPCFLADRIARLSSAQLNSLARPYRQSSTPDSVLHPSSIYGKFDPRNFHRNLSRTSDPLPSPEDLLRDPILLLLHGLFDSSAQWGSPERQRQLDAWSSVCARIIEDGKPGSDDFCLTILDAFADFSPWTITPELEIFLLDLVRSGDFIVGSQGNQAVNFSQDNELHNARIAVATSEFFDNALSTLVGLLTRTSVRHGVPRASLDLARTTLEKVQNPEKKVKARSFFISRWFCTSFLSNALIWPENHHMMMDHHIPAAARQKLFRELAARFQRHVSNHLSPWPPSDPISTDLTSGIKALLGIFDQAPGPLDPSKSHDHEAFSDSAKNFFVLGSRDVLSLATALYPEDASDSAPGSLSRTPFSVASSVTGSSTLTAGTNDHRTGAVSSFAPSISGTSMTSNTLSNDLFMNQADKVHDAIKNLDLSGKSRPSTSGGGTMEANKDSSLSFLPDLWKLISRDTTESGSVLGHDVVTFYISSDNGTTLLRPPKPNVDVSLPESLRIRPRPTSLGLMTKEDHDILTEGLSQVSRSLHAGHPILSTSNSSTVASLLSLFNENMQMSQSQYDFQASHFWFKCLQALTSLPSNAIDEFLLAITKNYRYNIETSIEICDQLQDWLFALEARRKTQSSIVHQSGIESRSLRDKMWFVSDVRHSSTYEDSLHVTRALKTMSGLVLTRQSGMAAWARQRLRSSFGHERAQAQVLETLAADKETGGPNKLTDGQVDLVSRWLLQEGIENLCKGEERIHRFCFEVQKCARKLVADTLMESPVLWSSVLYQQEKQDFVSGSGHHGTPSTSEYPSWRSEFSSSGISNLSQLPATSPNPGFSSYDASRPGFTFKNGGSNRPGSGSVAYGLAIQDPGIFPSQPPNTYASLPQNWVFPPSPVSPMMMNNSSDVKLPQKQAFVEQLRSTITNLLLSDLGSVLWTFGSETDRWVLDYQRHLQEQISNDPPIVLTQTSVSVQSSSPTKTITVDTYKANDDSEIDDQSCQTPTTRRQPAAHIPGNTFPYHESFKKLLEKFQLSSDPRLKLKALHDLVSLIESRSRSSNAAGESETSPVPSNDPVLQDLTSHGLLGVGLPRTRLTRLQEVTANCEDRRLTSLATSTMGNPLAVTSLENLFTRPVDQRGHNTVAIIRAMFHDSSYRPPTFFRDLQYIAAFIPSSVLDHSAQGNAFWTVALAAMSLKSEMCKLMTSRATQILAHHLENGSTREPIREGSKERPRATVGNKMSQEELSHTTLEDAAQMYMLSALEGDPTAARELGLFYLTHPELVKRVTLPLSRPSEVFRPFINPSGDRNHRATGDGGGVLEPGTFAVAFHWMEFAANAGDADARTFLRENGELGRGW